MGTIYKIHPAIGFARLGNHESAFYIGPEEPGSPGVEIGLGGLERPVKNYKADGRIKRQGARFRVIAYNEGASGELEPLGEVPMEQVTWRVLLCNRKGDLKTSEYSPSKKRNRDVTDRDSLVIRPSAPVTVAGPNRRSGAIGGKFRGEEVYLGEARTDALGRLIVLGGRGVSASVPANEPLKDYANNDHWHDDVSDGPVTATVTPPVGPPVEVDYPAWVVVGPPDFAPTIAAPVSLYHIAFQAAVDKKIAEPVPTPSFTRDIRPLIERTVAMAWVRDWETWSSRKPDWNRLADPSDDAKPGRVQWATWARNPGLSNYELPPYLDDYLKQWEKGDFTSGLDAEPAVASGDRLDRASLDASVGASFYPGIEAGAVLKKKQMYREPFRLDDKATERVYPGCLTEMMAVPWQSDFYECRTEQNKPGRPGWWPSARPDIAMTDPSTIPASKDRWVRPIAEPGEARNPDQWRQMIENWMRFGFVVEQQVDGRTVFVEAERDPNFRQV